MIGDRCFGAKYVSHANENGIEFQYTRDLMKVLSYKDERYFEAIIEKAR